MILKSRNEHNKKKLSYPTDVTSVLAMVKINQEIFLNFLYFTCYLQCIYVKIWKKFEVS